MTTERYVADFGCHNNRLAEWKRTSFYDRENDEVYLPAFTAGDEVAAFFCACHDGVTFVHDAGHLYLPASWIRREHPDIALALDKAVAATRAAAGLSESEPPKLPLRFDPANLDQLREWASQWKHLDAVATQVARLFEQWNARVEEFVLLSQRLGETS